MVDTVRSLSALQTLLADNTSGAITAQVIRDMLVSVFPPQFSGARVVKSGDQATNAGSNTTVLWGAEVYDTDGYHDTGSDTNRLTVPSTDYYEATFGVRITGTDTQTYVVIENQAGSDLAAVSIPPEGYGAYDEVMAVITTGPIALTAANWLSCVVYTDLARTITSDARSFFAIKRLGQTPV